MNLYQNDYDTVKANSLEEALALYCQWIGEEESAIEASDWHMVNPERVISIWLDNHPREPGDEVVPPEAKLLVRDPENWSFLWEATAAQWAAVGRPAWLCSTEA